MWKSKGQTSSLQLVPLAGIDHLYEDRLSVEPVIWYNFVVVVDSYHTCSSTHEKQCNGQTILRLVPLSCLRRPIGTGTGTYWFDFVLSYYRPAHVRMRSNDHWIIATTRVLRDNMYACVSMLRLTLRWLPNLYTVCEIASRKAWF